MVSTRHVVTEVAQQLEVVRPHCNEWQQQLTRMLSAGKDGWVRLSVKVMDGKTKTAQVSVEITAQVNG